MNKKTHYVRGTGFPLCSKLTPSDKIMYYESMNSLNFSLYRSNNCAHHDNFEYQCQKFSP